MLSASYYPPAAFHFAVSIVPGTAQPTLMPLIDASFQEVTGLTGEIGSEEVNEGGENRFTHKLPKAAKYPNLVLKRGLVSTTSELILWFNNTLTAGLNLPIKTHNVVVQLLNEDGLPLVVWTVSNAYPARWEISALNSMESKVVVETMELAYNFFERRDLGALYGGLPAGG